MNETIMGRFRCPSHLIRAKIWILFILTLSCVIQQPNAALNNAATITSTPTPTTTITTDSTIQQQQQQQQQQMVHSEKMSTFNNYNHKRSSSGSGSSSSSSSSEGSNNDNKNRFSSIRQILYHRPPNHWYVNETLRWHKIDMISNLFKHRVKRKVKQSQHSKSNNSSGSGGSISSSRTDKNPLQSNISITTSNAIIYEQNINTNTIDFSNNQQIHDILTFVHLNMLLNNQRSIHNATTADNDDNLALNFSHNLIKQIDANLLTNSLAHRVRRLDLSFNKIEMFRMESVSSSSSGNNSHQIEWLSISNNALKSFNGENLKHLKYLDLSCNNIGNVSQIRISATTTNTNDNSSSGNDSSLLEYVNLSGNRLNQLQVAHVVEKLIKLKVMNLAFNRLERIHDAMFRNSVDIEALDLSHNRIAVIESASFSMLLKLQYLDLSYNFIDAISLRAFQPIPNLRKLSIAFNRRLGDALQGFISSWSLKHLDMSGTGLCEIPNALTQSVRTLNISYNNFGVIRCGDLDSYPLLQHLDISSCHTVDIEEDALGRLDMLITLHLNNNNITHVPSSLPVNLIQLFLQSNRIAEIQSSTFSHLIHLEVVNLAGNQLTYIPSLPLPRLMVLDLRATGLRRLSSSIIKMSPELRIVYLDGNPIKCNELLGVAEWATPCRTDDFTEIGNFGGSGGELANNVDRMEPSKIWSKCDCEACQPTVLVDSIDQSKLHCNNKNTTNSKRIRFTEMPPSNDSGGSSVLINGNPLTNDTLTLNLTSMNGGNGLMENRSRNDVQQQQQQQQQTRQTARRNHDESKSETFVNGQQLKPMNGFRLHNNSTAHSIAATAQQQQKQKQHLNSSSSTVIDAIIVQTESSPDNDNLNVTNTRHSTSSLSIITNDVSATVAKVNRPNAATATAIGIESSPMEMVKTNENSKIDAQSADAVANRSDGMSATSKQSFASILPLNRNKNAKKSEFMQDGNVLTDEKLTNKPMRNLSSRSGSSSKTMPPTDEVLHSDLNQMRIRFDYKTSAGNVNKQRRNHIENDARHYGPTTNEMPISTNKLESLIAMAEFTAAPTTTTAPSIQAVQDDSNKKSGSGSDGDGSDNKNSNRINFQYYPQRQRQQQHFEHNASDHKVNKSQANWNINKAISTANDNLQRDRNLLPAPFVERGDDNSSSSHSSSNDKLLDSSGHINEINKNQLAAGNQLNVIRTSNIDANAMDAILVGAPRENPVKESDDDQQTIRTLPSPSATMKKTKKIRLAAQNNGPKNKNITNTSTSNNITIDKGLNKRIINSNSSTETDGMVINDVMKNGQQISAINEHVSRDAPGKIAIETGNGRISAVGTATTTPASAESLIDVHKESVNIGLAQMSIDSSISSESNQMLGNDTDTMAKTSGSSVDGRAMAAKGSSFEIQAEDKVVVAAVDGNNDGNQQKDEQMQQIKNATTTITMAAAAATTSTTTKTAPPPPPVANVSTVDRAAAETSAKENPLIGRISQNVSIIDNEHQFQWHINIGHSMHGQKAFESGTSTKLQSSSSTTTSADDELARTASTQDRYGNSAGDEGSKGDNSRSSSRTNDDGNRSGSSATDDISDNSAIHGISEQWNDKRVTSGHSGLFVIIGIGIGVFVTLNFVHIYRLHKRRRQYNGHRGNAAAAASAAGIATTTSERNRQAENNLLIGMQMEMLNTTHYTDTPIDLW